MHVIKKKAKWYSDIQRNLAALKQCNITIGQLPFILREWRLWLRITRNFREIEGSWMSAILRYIRMFEDRPQRRVD